MVAQEQLPAKAKENECVRCSGEQAQLAEAPCISYCSKRTFGGTWLRQSRNTLGTTLSIPRKTKETQFIYNAT